MRITPLGDSALTIEVGTAIDAPTHARVQAVAAALAAAKLPGVSELVPAFASVTVFYDPRELAAAGAPVEALAGWLEARVRAALRGLPRQSPPVAGRTMELPVCFDADLAPDLAEVAQHAGLTPAEAAARVCGADYLVHLLGFAPGFPYMSGLPAELARPRRATPRAAVAAGSVGVVGAQLCVYPLATPGGWNLIGRTPQRLFCPETEPPVWLLPGDRVRVRALTRAEFDERRER